MKWRDFLVNAVEYIGKAFGRKKKSPEPEPEATPAPAPDYPPAPTKVIIDDKRDIFVINQNVE